MQKKNGEDRSTTNKRQNESSKFNLLVMFRSRFFRGFKRGAAQANASFGGKVFQNFRETGSKTHASNI
jgi:hypothetical protein